MKYKHLSQAERYQIYALMKAGHDQTQIAKQCNLIWDALWALTKLHKIDFHQNKKETRRGAHH